MHHMNNNGKTTCVPGMQCILCILWGGGSISMSANYIQPEGTLFDNNIFWSGKCLKRKSKKKKLFEGEGFLQS